MEFIDLKTQYRVLKKEIDVGIANVLEHGQFIMGKEVEEFEKELGKYVGRQYVISCANGTDALQIIYMAYGIGMGDAVFCPDITFIASVEPACMLGATPVFCDIDPKTYNICTNSLEERIAEVIKVGKHKPKAVVAVDFLGNPADYVKLESICNKYNLILVEDAAQSMGASYNGKQCCKFGHSATTSFFPAKPLGCYGDGGAIFTDDYDMAKLYKSIRVHGKGASKYENIRIGSNSRLDTIQAAILLPKLKALEECEMVARQKVAKFYNDAFEGKFVTPYVQEGAMSSYAQYALLAENKQERDEMVRRLTKANIPNMIYYPYPMHTLKVFENIDYKKANFVNADSYCERTFSLPMSAYITQEEQEEVINSIK